MYRRKFNADDLIVLHAYADGNMNGQIAAKLSHFSPSAVYKHLDQIHALTGKNPRNFYELHELINIYRKEE